MPDVNVVNFKITMNKATHSCFKLINSIKLCSLTSFVVYYSDLVIKFSLDFHIREFLKTFIMSTF